MEDILVINKILQFVHTLLEIVWLILIKSYFTKNKNKLEKKR